jgi:ribosomal protein L18E
MLEKAQKDNKILMQLINNHKKTAEEAKNKVSRDIQMLNLFITMVSQLLIKHYKFTIMFVS